jgi:hypothetical protein
MALSPTNSLSAREPPEMGAAHVVLPMHCVAYAIPNHATPANNVAPLPLLSNNTGEIHHF